MGFTQKVIFATNFPRVLIIAGGSLRFELLRFPLQRRPGLSDLLLRLLWEITIPNGALVAARQVREAWLQIETLKHEWFQDCICISS